MCGHPLEVTLKLTVSVLLKKKKKKFKIFVKFNFESALFASVWKRHWNGVYRVDTGEDRPKGGRKKKALAGTFFPPRKAQAQIVYIFTLVLFLLWRLPHCSLRCVTYGKQWISQCTVCSQNMLWLTFHWSRLSLRLPAKIVAVHFGRLPVWIYGGVSLSQDWWLVWVAVADCWVFCPMISASHLARVHPLFPKLVIQGSRGNKWRGSKERIQQNDSSESCAPAVCIMYNACARACNKQQGGVVRCPIGGSWTSAPTPEFPKI